jgi:hypothetical protein
MRPERRQFSVRAGKLGPCHRTSNSPRWRPYTSSSRRKASSTGCSAAGPSISTRETSPVPTRPGRRGLGRGSEPRLERARGRWLDAHARERRGWLHGVRTQRRPSRGRLPRSGRAGRGIYAAPQRRSRRVASGHLREGRQRALRRPGSDHRPRRPQDGQIGRAKRSGDRCQGRRRRGHHVAYRPLKRTGTLLPSFRPAVLSGELAVP